MGSIQKAWLNCIGAATYVCMYVQVKMLCLCQTTKCRRFHLVYIILTSWCFNQVLNKLKIRCRASVRRRHLMLHVFLIQHQCTHSLRCFCMYGYFSCLIASKYAHVNWCLKCYLYLQTSTTVERMIHLIYQCTCTNILLKRE